MPLLLVLLFIIVPIAELALLIQVGQLIGVWWTVALLIADAVLGSWLLRTQSRAAWRRFNEAINEARIPHREVVDGVLVIFGGVLLLTPGLHHRRLRPAVPVPADARAAARPARAPRRAEARRLDARHAERRPNGRRPTDIEGSAVDIDSDPGPPR